MRNSIAVPPMFRFMMPLPIGVWWLAVASVVAAQDAPVRLPPLPSGSLVALLPPGGTAQAVSGARAPARVAEGGEAGETLQARSELLRRKGFRVLLPAQVSARLAGHSPDGCRNPATCDPELARATLGADAVVSSAVWQRANSASQVVVHVRRARGYGQSEISVGGPGSKGLRAAAESALSAALEDSQRTHELPVEIESQPSGAKLLIDQTLSARTPAQVSLLPGNHLVSLEAPGHVSRAQYIEVPEQAGGPLRYRLQLTAANAAEPSATAAPALPPPSAAAPLLPEAPAEHAELSLTGYEHSPGAEPSRQRETSTWNYVVAVALFALAVPLLANAIYGAATQGECVGEIDPRDRCADRVSLGPAFYASLLVGGAALVGGTTFLIVQPISTEIDSRPRGATLQLRHVF
jgi:hypothetical protein